MPRPRSTYHCLECQHYDYNDAWCKKDAFFFRVTRKQERTSPSWCPLGHKIPGRAYPTFSPGLDPRTPGEDPAAPGIATSDG